MVIYNLLEALQRLRAISWKDLRMERLLPHPTIDCLF